jgi:hypothetical protein
LLAGVAGLSRLEAHGERFTARVREDGLWLRHIAPEGDVEDEMYVPRTAFLGLEADHHALTRLPATAALAEAAAALAELSALGRSPWT